VICGPNENASVVDIGDAKAVIVEIETKQPSEQHRAHEGAATGVGGILRDIFTMGAASAAISAHTIFLMIV
jgi:phosphoribosylformylglycinamidine synthase